MGEMIGRGRSTVKRKVEQCVNAGGVPLLRTSFANEEFRSKVIFACWGAGEQVSGGTIKGLSPSLVKKIRTEGYKMFTGKSEEKEVEQSFVREW